MASYQLFNQIRDLIARDELEQALQQLRQLLANSPKLDEALQQSGRFADIRKQIRPGVVSHAEAALTQNQIRHALLKLLDEIGKQQAQAPALREELDRAVTIVQSKNVVAGSTISAGGSVHIGDVHNYASPPMPALDRPLNVHLTKVLICAIQPYSVSAVYFFGTKLFLTTPNLFFA